MTYYKRLYKDALDPSPLHNACVKTFMDEPFRTAVYDRLRPGWRFTVATDHVALRIKEIEKAIEESKEKCSAIRTRISRVDTMRMRLSGLFKQNHDEVNIEEEAKSFAEKRLATKTALLADYDSALELYAKRFEGLQFFKKAETVSDMLPWVDYEPEAMNGAIDVQLWMNEMYINHDRLGSTCIEVKPIMGDDYPAVMRQMKLSKFLCVWRYVSAETSREELKSLFDTKGIRVMFYEEMNELWRASREPGDDSNLFSVQR